MRIVIAAGLLGILASGVLADTVLYNFNSGTTLGTALTSPYTGTKVSEQSTGGLDNSGSINFDSGNGDQAWFSKEAYNQLEEGYTLSVSLYFQFKSATDTTSIKLGFATNNKSLVNDVAMPLEGQCAYFGVWTNSAAANIGNEALLIIDGNSGGTLGDTSAYSESFSNNNWYYMEFDFTLTEASTSTFKCDWLFRESDSSGNLGYPLFSGTGTNSLPGMNTNLYVYIGMENPTSTSSYAAIDNLTMFSQGNITPEPATIALLVAGGIALLRHRRK